MEFGSCKNDIFIQWISYDRRGKASPVFQQAQPLRCMGVEVEIHLPWR